ncbi:hypothetical protein MOQ72_06890 [Saccharopolyspora sp. K220]|uniref:hypothetical protein n=1 Tax=Saccharopolyspora soli TaxID=2926618 RepID=UPI001F563E62|nr:hypothetical protein [Saccharopolyspora soli]MCI2417142.1 hypothetical protein [Saccharopolyspora soli]
MRPRRNGRRAALMIAVVLAAAIPGTALAQAAPPGKRHCSFHLSSGEYFCFATRQQAAERAEAGEVIQATLFDEQNFGGDSFTVYGEAPCEKDGVVNYQLNLPDDWKNRISSAQPWANCAIWLYPEPDLGGERDGPFEENTGYVGDLMNDRTQSIGLS